MKLGLPRWLSQIKHRFFAATSAKKKHQPVNNKKNQREDEVFPKSFYDNDPKPK